MKKHIITFFSLIIIFTSCSKEKVDKSYGVLTHEDVVSIEENSVFSYEQIIYSGKFSGVYFDEKIELELNKNGNYLILYKGKKIEGEWFIKDDGSLIEFDGRKKLPFQFMSWSDNNTLMILNADETADDNGQNYLMRIEK